MVTGRRRIAVGQLLGIPVDQRFAVAQAVAVSGKRVWLLDVHDGLYAKGTQPDPTEFAARPRAFLCGVLLGAMLPESVAPGWAILGPGSVPPGLPLPAYVAPVRRGEAPHWVDEAWIQDFEGNLLRLATPAEEKRLPRRHFCSPAVLVAAMKAAYGIEPWSLRMDMAGLRPPRTEDTLQALMDR